MLISYIILIEYSTWLKSSLKQAKLLYYVYYRDTINASWIEWCFSLFFPMVCKNGSSNKTNICQHTQKLYANKCKKSVEGWIDVEKLFGYPYASVLLWFIFPIYLPFANLILHFPSSLIAFWGVEKITLPDSLLYNKHEIQVHWMKRFWFSVFELAGPYCCSAYCVTPS